MPIVFGVTALVPPGPTAGEKVAIKYSFAVTKAPDGNGDTVKHPAGTVRDVEAFEFQYPKDGTWPTVTPPRAPASTQCIGRSSSG